jgi:hypothetical protein
MRHRKRGVRINSRQLVERLEPFDEHGSRWGIMPEVFGSLASDRRFAGNIETQVGAGSRRFSARADDSVNPGGPIRGLSTVNPRGPMIPKGSPIVYYFTFTITRGTAQYAHDRGTGSVEIPTTTGLTGLPGPGI